jgi:hypothetical protein
MELGRILNRPLGSPMASFTQELAGNTQSSSMNVLRSPTETELNIQQQNEIGPDPRQQLCSQHDVQNTNQSLRSISIHANQDHAGSPFSKDSHSSASMRQQYPTPQPLFTSGSGSSITVNGPMGRATTLSLSNTDRSRVTLNMPNNNNPCSAKVANSRTLANVTAIQVSSRSIPDSTDTSLCAENETSGQSRSPDVAGFASRLENFPSTSLPHNGSLGCRTRFASEYRQYPVKDFGTFLDEIAYLGHKLPEGSRTCPHLTQFRPVEQKDKDNLHSAESIPESHTTGKECSRVRGSVF